MRKHLNLSRKAYIPNANIIISNLRNVSIYLIFIQINNLPCPSILNLVIICKQKVVSPRCDNLRLLYGVIITSDNGVDCEMTYSNIYCLSFINLLDFSNSDNSSLWSQVLRTFHHHSTPD